MVTQAPSCRILSSIGYILLDSGRAIAYDDEMEPISYMDGIGKAVRVRRKQLHIDQQTVADLAGVSRKAVSDIERGKPTIRFDVLARVLTAVGLKIDVS